MFRTSCQDKHPRREASGTSQQQPGDPLDMLRQTT